MIAENAVPMFARRGFEDAPCRVLLLGAESPWVDEFRALTKRLGLKLKRLDSPIDALVNVHDYDPHIFIIDHYHGDLSLVDLCDALRVPRIVQPVALLVTTQVSVPRGGDLAELGVDDVLSADTPLDQAAVAIVQHYRLVTAERRLLARERDILDSLPNALIIVDESLTIWKVNRALATLFGIEDPASLRLHLGKPLGDALRTALGPGVSGDAGERLIAALSCAMRSGKNHFECREIVGYSERLLAGQITPLEGDSGHFLVDVRDITDHEQALLREARRERLATIGNLSVGVAHEIQNPNTFSRVNAANLKALFDALRPLLEEITSREPERSIGSLPAKSVIERISAAISGVETASQRIAAVLETLKSFGRNDSGTVGNVDVSAVIEESVLLTKHHLRGKATLTVELPEDLPPVQAVGSELSQVFVNLIENAVQAFDFPGPQARGQGPAEIRITLHRLSAEELIVSVSDNGPGIDETIQASIFRPYFTTRAQGEGTGLGLSISSDIMHRFGGDLAVRSRRGKGATFLVTLKRADLHHRDLLPQPEIIS